MAGRAGETNQLSAAETRPQKPRVMTTFLCAGVMGRSDRGSGEQLNKCCETRR